MEKILSGILDLNDNGIFIVAFIAIALLVGIALREVKCWYYKINERILILENIDSKLERLCLAVEKMDGDSKENVNKEIMEKNEIVNESILEESKKVRVKDILRKEIRIEY